METHIHGVPPRRLLAGMSLRQSPVDRISQRVFPQVGENLIIDLESGKVLGCGDGFFGEGFHYHGFVALGIDEFVVHDLDAGVVLRKLGDPVGNGLSVGEGWNVLPHTSEAEHHVLGVGAAELGFTFLADDGDVQARVFL